MHFPRPLGDPIKQHLMFNVAAGSFYLSRYGHSGVGVPLQVVARLPCVMNVTDSRPINLQCTLGGRNRPLFDGCALRLGPKAHVPRDREDCRFRWGGRA